jgi:hypothetical protein
MTLQEFTHDIVPIGGTVIAAIGLFGIWYQIRQAAAAILQSSSWNKINSTYNLFDLNKNSQMDLEVRDYCAKSNDAYLM